MIKFELNKTEEAVLNEWLNEHKKTCVRWTVIPRRQFTLESPLTFSFTPTGVGDGCTVTCKCGEEKDVTDYDSW